MKVCFIGIGSIAKRHIRNLVEICKEDGITIQIDALRRQAQQIENVSCVYTQIEEMPSDYDAIFLTNPTEYHAEMLIKLHDRAKHFFIEKPVTSLGTMQLLKNFEYRSDSVYYVACPLRYNSVIQYLKDNIDVSKVIGVRSISSSYLPDWRPGVDYRKTYSAQKALGGGVSIDLIHEWDYLTHLFGFPVAVKVMKGKISNLEIDSDDYAIYIAEYETMIAEVHLDYFGRKSIRRVELFLEDDTVIGDLITGKVNFMISGKCVELAEERDDYQKRELRNFISLMNGKEGISSKASHAIEVLKISQGE